MYKILKKKKLNSNVTMMVIDAPLVAKRAKAGQFIILRVNDSGERIPLTIADYNKEEGTITIIFQVVGATTILLDELNEGEYIKDFVGPLGRPTEISGLKKVAVIGGGVGCAIAYPVAKALHQSGCDVDAIIGFRSKEYVILEEEFSNVSNRLFVTTDDGSYKERGVVTEVLERLISLGNNYDEVIAIGPLIMMKYVVATTKPHNIKTIVSMNPIMIDGTGMCGGCRLTVGGKVKFACVDGPEFDGALVDFDEAISRNKSYLEFENHQKNSLCNLLKKGVDYNA